MDLALNNLQRLICHKTKQTKPSAFYVDAGVIALFYAAILVDEFVI